MVIYISPKHFTVKLTDDTGRIVRTFEFDALQKTDNDFLSNLIGKAVNETFIIKNASFREY